MAIFRCLVVAVVRGITVVVESVVDVADRVLCFLSFDELDWVVVLSHYSALAEHGCLALFGDASEVRHLSLVGHLKLL